MKTSRSHPGAERRVQQWYRWGAAIEDYFGTAPVL
jgi:hypothetical protein